MGTNLSKKKFPTWKNYYWVDILVICFIVVVSIFYFSGIPSVPFHPDESTQIFMSDDFFTLFTDPKSLFWSAQDPSLKQHYREIDSPLTRDVIGFSRWISSSPGLKNDWNWSKTWDENVSNSAYPIEKLLLSARFAVASVFPFSLFFLYLSGKKVQGRITSAIAVILFASDSLVLLHTRRAMAESLLVFFIILSLYFILSLQKHLWLISVPIALAVNAKQFAIFLIPLGIFVLILKGIVTKKSVNRILLQLGLFLIILLAITYLLNPFLWTHPVQAIRSSIQERTTLTISQQNALKSEARNALMDSIGKQTAGLLGNLFFQAPAIQDIGNFSQNLQTSSIIYLSNSFHTILRSIIGGALLLLLYVAGVVVGLYKVFRKQDDYNSILIIFIGNVFLLAEYFSSIQLPFQRYIISFVPFLVFWIGFLFSTFLNSIIAKLKKKPVQIDRSPDKN